MKITSDNELNPQLKAQVQGLRGGIVAQANERPCPDRFMCESHREQAAITITDTETGNKTTVPLFAYGEVRTALLNLFGK